MPRVILVCTLTVVVALARNLSDCRAEDSLQLAEPATSDGPLAEVPLSIKRVPLVAVKCLGEERTFIFDTGCTVSALDESFRDRLGDLVFTRTNVSAAGRRQVDSYPAPDITLGGVELSGGLVMCVDMELFSNACGVPIAGIIGLDQIKNFVVELDLTGKKLRLFKQLPTRVERDSERFEMRWRSAGWSISGTAAGIGSDDFVIDTGADWSIALDQGKFDRESDTPFIRDRGMLKLLTAGGTVHAQEGRLQRFTLGSYEHEWIHVSSHPGDSVLGIDYLRRYVVVFNFARKHLYLRPSPQYHATIETDDRSGLSVDLYDDQIVVTQCEPESPAHMEGIRARDRLLRVDDQALEDWSLRHVREHFRREGESVEVIARRGEETFTRKFTLRNYRKRPPAPALPIPEHVPSR